MNTKKFYDDRFLRNGRDISSVGWRDRESQFLRFEILHRALKLDGKSILDFGCGLGDLLTYLESIGVDKFNYTGLDISAPMIEDNIKFYQGKNAKFISGDILDLDIPVNSFDIVFASGAFSYRPGTSIEQTEKYVEKLFSITKEVLALNFLSSYVDFENEKNIHYSPEDFFAFAKRLTKNVNLYHDYPLYEFTVQMKKG